MQNDFPFFRPRPRADPVVMPVPATPVWTWTGATCFGNFLSGGRGRFLWLFGGSYGLAKCRAQPDAHIPDADLVSSPYLLLFTRRGAFCRVYRALSPKICVGGADIKYEVDVGHEVFCPAGYELIPFVCCSTQRKNIDFAVPQYPVDGFCYCPFAEV